MILMLWSNVLSPAPRFPVVFDLNPGGRGVVAGTRHRETVEVRDEVEIWAIIKVLAGNLLFFISVPPRRRNPAQISRLQRQGIVATTSFACRKAKEYVVSLLDGGGYQAGVRLMTFVVWQFVVCHCFARALARWRLYG